jgi:hypothetical protein
MGDRQQTHLAAVHLLDLLFCQHKSSCVPQPPSSITCAELGAMPPYPLGASGLFAWCGQEGRIDRICADSVSPFILTHFQHILTPSL